MKKTSLIDKYLRLSVNLNRAIILLLWDLRLRASARSSQVTSNIALFPYGAIDCELQYKIIEKYLNRITDKKFTINYIKPIKRPPGWKAHDDEVLLSYDEKLEYLYNIVGISNVDLIRGAFDEYRRRCSVVELLEKSTIDKELIQDIIYQINSAKKIVDENMILIMPDLAYAKNRSIKHFAKKKEKRVLIINPYGEVRNISNYGPLDPDPSKEELQNIKERFSDDFDIQGAAITYVKKRVSGDITNDLDAQRAFGKRQMETSLNFANKKILFLHCIADSANVSIEIALSEDIILNDYFLWTREMFKIISKDPSKWLIKIHPASKLYPKDFEILGRLMKKFMIPNEIIIPEEISTLQILRSKAPIFTHSGTIALESAALGQQSVCVKGRFDDDIAFNVRSMKEIERLSTEEPSSLQEILKNNQEKSILAATWLFLWRTNFDYGEKIAVKHPIQPNMSSRKYLLTQHQICIEFYKKILSKNFHSQLSELLLPLVSNSHLKS